MRSLAFTIFLLTLMQSASMAQAAQTRAHNLAMNIANLVLKGLIGLI